MTVDVDTASATLTIPDIGVTVRTLLAYAAKGYRDNSRRRWRLVYKGALIGHIRIKVPEEAAKSCNFPVR